MSTREIIYAAAGASGPANYIEDVFSTWLYTGNGSSQTINNGIDLATKGGLTWIKRRDGANGHFLVDSVRGITQGLASNSTTAQFTDVNAITAFNTNGFSIGASYNTSSATYASWTFREQPKFFDVVTFTATGSSQAISHSLASTPGMIFFKRTDGASNWLVWNRTYPAQYYQTLNTTAAAADLGAVWCTPTSTNVTVDVVFGAGQTWVAYLFAHDAGGFGTSSTDNVISCGSYSGTGAAGNPITLGYEPQWILVKPSSAVDPWIIVDNMRGDSLTSQVQLKPNASDAEFDGGGPIPTATGFNFASGDSAFNGSGRTYIYMAIRRGPMKKPTSGTQVFSPNRWNTTAGSAITTGFTVDLHMSAWLGGSNGTAYFQDRLRGLNSTTTNGAQQYLTSPTTSAEVSSIGLDYGFNNTGFLVGSGFDNGWAANFRRAPGFFDVVCYTGTGSATTQAHNLGVAPELMIVKRRNATWDWYVYSATSGAGNAAFLNYNFNFSSDSQAWNSTSPTSTVFSIGNTAGTNASNSTYVAYLFATCPGVSKVGSYTGTGGTQTINAGLPTGARFVFIKRTDDVGNWWIWDTARGMVAGTDPRLALNSTAAETNANWVYTTTNGFQIVTTDATVNASGGSYIYLAIA